MGELVLVDVLKTLLKASCCQCHSVIVTLCCTSRAFAK